MKTDMRAALTVTADASQVVSEARRGAEAWREFRRETGTTGDSPATDRAARASRALVQEQEALSRAFRDTAAASGSIDTALDGISKSAEASAAVFAAALDRDEQSMRELASSLDPALRAMEQFEAAQLRIAIAVATGATEQAEAVRMLDQLTQRYDIFIASQRRNPDAGSARASAGVFEAAFAEQEQAQAARRAFEALEASLDPLVRAERELAQAREVVTRAQQAGVLTDAESARTLVELQSRYHAVVQAQTPAVALAVQRERAIEEETRAVRELMLSVDSAARAQHQFEQAQEQVTRAVRLGIITQEEATRTLNLLEAQQQAVSRGSFAMAGDIQNASFQFTDMIVQLQGGVAPSVAIAQQLPQLLGGFGALGAVLGLVVAAGVPLITWLFDAGDAAGSLDDRLQRLDTALGAVADHLKVLQDADAAETFGNMTGTVRELTRDLLALERAAELRAFSETLDKLTQENIQPGIFESAWEGLKQGAQFRFIYTPGQIDATQDRIERGKYAELTGGRGPGYDEFQARRSEIIALAKAGELEKTAEKVSQLINSFTNGGPVTELNAELAKTLTTLGEAARRVAEVEAEFNLTAQAARLWSDVTDNASALWDRVRDAGRAIKEDGEERLRIAENELSLAQVIAEHGAESKEAEAERDRIARESYEIELERAGIYGEQKDRLLEIFDQHNAVTDATAVWADAMAGVRGEIEGILAAIASLGGGLVERAAKQAQIRALQAGATIAEAAAAGTATRREAQFNARSSALGGGLLGRTVAGVERWWNEGADAQDATLSALQSAARKRDRSKSGGRSGGSGGLNTVASIKGELARLRPSYEADVEAAEAWRDKALASLKKAGAGYSQYATDVQAIFQEKLADAYEADLKRRDDWAAGIERALLKQKEEMTSWADFSESVMTKWAEAGEDAFVSFVKTGKATLSDFVDFVADAFARMAYQQVIGPGLSSLMGSLLGGIGGIFNLPVGATGAGLAVPTNHTGSPGVMRSYAMSGYGDTARPDEKLTMMRDGEQILTSRALENAGALISTLSALAARSAQPVQIDSRPQVTVITKTSVPLQVEQSETVDDRGGRQQQLVISEAVATGLRAPGGAARKTLAHDFGVRRRGIDR